MADEETNIVIETPGFTFTLDSNAKPISFTNSSGTDLLQSGASKGFFLKEYDRSFRVFDSIEPLDEEENEYLFKIIDSTEEVGVKFGGTESYMTVEFTKLEGFPMKGESLTFELRGTEKYLLKSIALDYMVKDYPFAVATITRWALWETSSHNPMGRFAVYEGLDDDAEDEILFDLWVNEGLPHPKVGEGEEWDREKAEKWIDDWTKLNYDMSLLAIVPKTFDEHYEFLPFAEKMGAKAIHMNFRVWASEIGIDDVKRNMYPNGKEDFLKFSQDCAELGMGISTHRMSGGLWPRDPYCHARAPNEGLDHWAKMTLVNDIEASDTTFIVEPEAGAQIPQGWKGRGARPPYPYPIIPTSNRFTCFLIGHEWVDAKNIVDLEDGTWEIRNAQRKRGCRAHAAGTEITGYYRGNIFFIPGANTDLLHEVAARYADINNFVQMISASFDGAAWHMMQGFWGFEKFASLCYQNLDHPTSSTTSHGVPPWAWIEYRFNRIKKAYGGSFEAGGGVSVFLGNKSRTSVSVEEVAFGLQKTLLANNRGISLAHSTWQNLAVFNSLGNMDKILSMVSECKKISFTLDQTQRNFFKTGRNVEKAKGPIMGYKPVLQSLWWIDGTSLRRWYCTGTDLYNHEYYEGTEHGPIQPRFYLQNGANQELFVPEGLASADIEKIRIVGRVLPRYDPDSENNIDLMEKMGIEGPLELTGVNNTGGDSFKEARLKSYPVDQLDLSYHGGIGLYVDGDDSGATLVIRLGTNGLARDFAIPINFSGRRWVEVANCEQGWRLRNWTWCGLTKKFIDFWKIVKVSIGLGYLPPNSNVTISVEGLKALEEIHDPIENPTITVGGYSVALVETKISTYNHFTLNSEGNFTVFDENWNVLSEEAVDEFLPDNLESFCFESSEASSDIWLEVCVQGSNETKEFPVEEE